MAYILPAAVRNLPLCRAVSLAHVTDRLPPAVIHDVLVAEGAVPDRVCRLDLNCTLQLLIAIHLEPRMRLSDVLATLLHTARLQHDPPPPVPGDAAICYRRQQLEGRPVVALYHQVARPLATLPTRGAWLGGFRLMALDGTTFDLPDRSGTRRVFGGPVNQHGAGRFPQLRAVLLVECGTHAIVDAGCWPYTVGEATGAHRLVRAVTPEMLVLLDRGLHSYRLIATIHARGGHVLSRLTHNITVHRRAQLADETWLVDLFPQDGGGHRHQPPLRLCLIDFTLDDPQADGQVYRLLTTLLDPTAFPGHTLAVAYHERMEAEGTLDELKTHLDLPAQPFRSQTPLGVVQEFYGLLLAHFLVRAVQHASAVEAGVDPDRVSFTRTVRVLHRYLPTCQQARRQELPWLCQRIREDVCARLLPPRRARANPRVVKQRRSTYPTKHLPPYGFRTRRPLPELIRLI